MADRYWVGGTNSWNATAGTKWATTSGGAGGAANPTSSDDVHFDANSGSGTVTFTTTSSMRSINFTGYTGTFTHSSGATMNIGDSTAGAGNVAMKLVAGMTYTLGNATTSAINFVSTSATTQTVDFAGKTAGNVQINASGASYQMTGSMLQGSTATFTLTRGAFDTNGQTVTWGILTGSNSNTRSLILDNSSITVSGANSWTLTTTTGLTFSATGSTITFTAATGTTLNFGALTYNNLVFTLGSGNCTVGGAFTCNALTFNGASNKTGNVTLSNSVTATTFTSNPNSVINRILFQSNTLGTARTITAGTVSIANTDFMDITGAGAGSWSGTSIGDCGGNSGITFTTAATQTWSGTSGGNWSTNAWTSRVPLPQDNVVISSAFSASQTVTADMPRLGKSIDMTGSSGSPTLSNSVAVTIFGSLTLISGMTATFNNGVVLGGRSSYTIDSAGKSFGSGVNVTAPSGSYALASDLTITAGALTLTAGTLNGNGYNVSGVSFSSSNSNTRTLTIGTGQWSFSGANVVWTSSTTTGLTVSASTGTINFTNTSSTIKQIGFGSGLTYPNVTITGGGTGIVSFTTAASMATLTATGPKTLQFNASSTYTVTGWAVSGSSGNIVTLQSSSSGSQYTLSKSSGTVSSDYLSIQDSNATGGATWYAGANSTDVSNNTGWTFTAPPGGGTTITGTGYANTNSFGSGTLNRVITLVGTGHASGVAFGSGTIVRGAVVVAGTGLASTNTFGGGTVQPGSVTISGTGYANASAFGQGIITRNQTLVGTGFANSTNFGGGILAASIAIAGVGFSNTNVFGGGELIQTNQVISGAGFANSQQFGTGALIAGTVTLIGAGLASSNLFGEGAVYHALSVGSEIASVSWEPSSVPVGTISNAESYDPGTWIPGDQV